MARVGIFGLGLIGIALARRLIAAGHTVAGHDPRQERRTLLAEAGGDAVDAAAVWRAPLILSAVFDTDQLAEVIRAAPLGTDAVLVSMSTCDPERMAALADKAAQRRLTLVEAPISGTSGAVAEGTALLLLAGDEAALDRFEEVRPALSDRAIRVGGIGDGNRTKLAINLILGLNRAALAEGLVFATAMGLDPGRFLAVAEASAAASAVMPGKGRAMVARDWTPLGRLEQSRKDFDLIAAAARSAGLDRLPFAGTYLDLVERAIAAGEGQLDNAALLLEIERAASPP